MKAALGLAAATAAIIFIWSPAQAGVHYGSPQLQCRVVPSQGGGGQGLQSPGQRQQSQCRTCEAVQVCTVDNRTGGQRCVDKAPQCTPWAYTR